MAFRKIACLFPSCEGCGLARSFRDPACPDGIPPFFAGSATALDQLPIRYGWQIQPQRRGRPLMACRRCAAAGIIPGTPGRAWLLAVTGWIRRFVPSGPICGPTPALPVAGHRESMTAEPPVEQEGLPGALDDSFFPGRVKGAGA
jgi:hypothetical protein